MIWNKFNFGPLMEEKNDENTIGDAGGENSEDSSEQDSNEETEESSEEGEESDSTDELDPKDLAEAKGLFKLLKDPNTRDLTIRAIADRAGIFKTGVETKTEEKKAIRDVEEILKESLGPEYYALFGDKLSKGMKEILRQEREESSKTTADLQLKAVQNETDRAFEKLDRETNGDSKKYRAQMTALADKILPAEGTSSYEYLQLLYTVASGGRKAQNASKQIADKINRNRTNVADRTQSASKGGTNNTPQFGGVKGLKSIVEAAVASAGKK